jgi:excisionase family DNA binding protein
MKQTNPPLPEVLNAKQAFDFLRISAPVGYRLLRSGEIRGTRIGHIWRVPRSELFRYLGLKRDMTPQGVVSL